MNDKRRLADQLRDLVVIANLRGMYDAAAWLMEFFVMKEPPMTNLKPCPCGKTPTHLFAENDMVFGSCCSKWSAPMWLTSIEMDVAWNDAPRAVPAVCPQCEGEGVVADVERLKDGGEWPCIHCPTCAPFGGRGAIMVEEDQQPEGEG